jgi:endoglucanase
MGSFSKKLCAPIAFSACVYLSAGCGSSPSNFYDAPSAGSGPASGGAGPASGGSDAPSGGSDALSGGSGAPSGGSGALSGGANLAGGANGGQTSGVGGRMGGPSDAPCSPAKDVSGGMSGMFGSLGPECFRVTADIVGWGCSNFDGRTIKVNGQIVICEAVPLPDKIDGAYYFDISAGTLDYASFYWY